MGSPTVFSQPGAWCHHLAGTMLHVGLFTSIALVWISPAPAGPDDGLVRAEPAPSLTIRVKVVDAETGKPVPWFITQYGRPDPGDPARIVWGWSENRSESANPEGRLVTSLSEKGAWQRVLADGYLPQPITERPYDGETGTVDATVRLRRGRQITGRVLDHHRRPLPGASVFLVGGRSAPNITGGKAVRAFLGGEDPTVTKTAADADGRFTMTGAGGDARTVVVSAPAFDFWMEPAPPEGKELEITLPEPGSLILRYDIDGGEPEAAFFLQLLREGRQGWEAAENLREPTLANRGRLVLANLTPGTYDVACVKKNLRVGDIGISPFCDRRNVVIEAGKPAEAPFVRESGTPVEGEVVGLKELKLPGAFLLVNLGDEARDGRPGLFEAKHVEALTVKADGRFQTPRLLPGTYTIVAEAYEPLSPEQRQSTGIRLADHRAFAIVTVPRDGPAPRVRIELPKDRPANEDDEEDALAAAKPAPLTVSGRVLDAATKRPIERFRIILGAKSSEGVRWQGHRISDHERDDGTFDLPPDERAWDQTWLRVEAEGYRPGISRPVKADEGIVSLEFALVADPGLSAVIQTPEGAPADGAQATWATNSHEAIANGATISSSADSRLGAGVVTADASGRLRLPPECDAGRILVAHASGYAEIEPAELAATPVVTLRRWGRVEGQVLAGTKPVAGRKVRVYHHGPQDGSLSGFCWEAEGVTDAAGRFVCDRVVQGRLIIDRVFPSGDFETMVSGLATTIEVRASQTTRVSLGGPGRTLVGRFEADRDLGLTIDWSRVHVRLALNAPHVGFPGDDRMWKTYGAFLDSDEGRAYYRDQLPVGRDGSFRVEGVPEGDYQLFAWVAGPAVGKPTETGRYFAFGSGRIEVAPNVPGVSDPPLSLGTIVVRTQDRGK
jgi:hypothetical protein